MTDEFITHNSTEPPELAPAVLVEYKVGAEPGILRVNEIIWHPGLEYRVLRNPDGHPYVSAEGLEDWARWVATAPSGLVLQSDIKPTRFTEGAWSFDNATIDITGDQFHCLGDWRDSLFAVWREDHE